MAIVKIHSHPSGYPEFSIIDDSSDAAFFPAAFSWSETESVHSSLVMLPDGSIFGRVYTHDMSTYPLEKISIIGDMIKIYRNTTSSFDDAFAQRTIQAFGEGTYCILKQLKVTVVGCSGTGSPTIEQLVRLGVGTIVIIDPDYVEEKNLNRILNATISDVGKAKVQVLAEAISGMGLGTKVITYQTNLYDSRDALNELIDSDIILGCVDSIDGRHLIGQLANFYLVPYLDMGVRLIADQKGGISNIVGSVNYIKPGYSSLLSRGLYSEERLRAESTKRRDPDGYSELLKQKYIHGIDVDRPAVISINMQISSLAVIELLNRIHGFKEDEPRAYGRVMFDFCSGCIDNMAEDRFPTDESGKIYAGRGYCAPFLRMPEFGV